jgi:hypothetical protein
MIVPKLMIAAAAIAPLALAGLSRIDHQPPPRINADIDQSSMPALPAYPKADRLPLMAAAPPDPVALDTMPVTSDAPQAILRAVMVEAPRHTRKPTSRRHDDVCNGRGKRYFFDRPHHRSWRCRR